MTEDQIKHLINRFLMWKLPKNFNPDNGISYKRPNYAPNVDATPSGTNLFGYTEADEMVRFMLDGMPEAKSEPVREVPADFETPKLKAFLQRLADCGADDEKVAGLIGTELVRLWAEIDRLDAQVGE